MRYWIPYDFEFTFTTKEVEVCAMLHTELEALGLLSVSPTKVCITRPKVYVFHQIPKEGSSRLAHAIPYFRIGGNSLLGRACILEPKPI